jgi:hypothetical protein
MSIRIISSGSVDGRPISLVKRLQTLMHVGEHAGHIIAEPPADLVQQESVFGASVEHFFDSIG